MEIISEKSKRVIFRKFAGREDELRKFYRMRANDLFFSYYKTDTWRFCDSRLVIIATMTNL